MEILSKIREEEFYFERQQKTFIEAMYRKLWLSNRRLRYVAFSPVDIFRAARTEIILIDKWDSVGIYK